MCFFASDEVHRQIQACRPPSSGTVAPRGKGTLASRGKLHHLPAILSWCLANTAKSTAEKLPYWASQGVTQFCKKRAYERLNYQADLDELGSLADACAEREVITLAEMYGHRRIQEPVPRVVEAMYQRRQKCFDCPIAVAEDIYKIMDHVAELGADVLCATSLLHEEQERELEAEQEEERQVERPAAATPATPKLSRGLVELALFGHTEETFLSLDSAIQQTSFGNLASWSVELCVTPEFVKTVMDKGHTDHYLRPVVWLLQGPSSMLYGRYDSLYVCEVTARSSSHAFDFVCFTAQLAFRSVLLFPPGRVKQVLISNFEAEAVARTFRKDQICQWIVVYCCALMTCQIKVSSIDLFPAGRKLCATLYGPCLAFGRTKHWQAVCPCLWPSRLLS